MDRLKRYFDIYVPTEVCNLKCSYCYIACKGQASNIIGKIGHSPEEIRKALSIKRLGGVCLLNFCAGGETLLGEEILPIIKELLKEGHYVTIVTNGILTEKIDSILMWDKELLERVMFKVSFHYLELKRLNLLERFFNNVMKIKESVASFSLEIMPHDELIPYIDDIKEISLKNVKALPHVTVGRDESTPDFKLLSKYSEEKYKEIWEGFNSEMFDFKMEMLREERYEFCYAGEWSLSLRLDTGDLYQCVGAKKIDNIYENIFSPLHFHLVGRRCPNAYCYNCHSYMAMGIFPEIETPTYAQVRDRECIDGSRWLSSKMQQFISQKFSDNNIEYIPAEKKYKIFAIGDDIFKNFIDNVRNELKEECEVIAINESARFTKYTLSVLSDWVSKLRIGSDVDLVYWNNGLEDVIRLFDDEPFTSLMEYKQNLAKIITRLHYLFPNADIVFSTTLPVNEEMYEDTSCICKNDDIVIYNQIAKEVMQKENILIDDLYEIGKGKEIYINKKCLNEFGKDFFAKHISEFIKNHLKMNNSKDLCYIKKDVRNIASKKIILYGYGKYGKSVEKKLNSADFSIFAIADSYIQSDETHTILGYDEVINCCKEEDDKVVIITIDNEKIFKDLKARIQKDVKVEVYHHSIINQFISYIKSERSIEHGNQ